MQFFEITCTVTNSEFLEKFNDENEPGGRWRRRNKDGFAYKAGEFYDDPDIPFYCFIAGIDGNVADIGFMMNADIDVPNAVYPFLFFIGMEGEDFTIKEVTFNRMAKMLRHANNCGFIEDDDEALGRFNLEGLSHPMGINFGENMVFPCSREQSLKEAESFLAGGQLKDEIERIYSAEQLKKDIKKAASKRPAKREYGHPVHYLFQTDDRTARREMYKTLITALYSRGRLRSRRYCFIDVCEGEHFSEGNLASLYESCASGTLVIRITEGGESLGDRLTDMREKMSAIARIARENRNEVLTIICMPQECTSIKNYLLEEMGTMSFVEICEEPVPVEDAVGFLKKVAKDNKVRTNKKLFEKLVEGQTYLTPDLLVIFDEWYDSRLKDTVYPQYRAVASSKEVVRNTAPKGDAYSKLQGMIGLDSAKEVINNAIDYFKAQKMFREKGMKLDQPSMHMVFTGNPGTAKTTVARLFATIMRDNRILSEGHLVEVGRADLVGKYVGSTAPLVKEAFKKAIGGVLFIDEAYSLVDDRDGLFGDEAINTIVQEMENNRDRLIVIFAGYPDKMEKFLEKNPGLRSRIAFHVNFDDYNTEELLSIADMIAEEKGLKLDGTAHKKLHLIFDEAKESPDFGNGRFVRNMIEKSRMCQASRLVKMDYDKVTKKDITTLCGDDIQMPKVLNESKKKHMGFCG